MTRFPEPIDHKPGLMNQYDCGCQIRRDSAGGYFIHACPMHNAAPKLLAACKLQFAKAPLYLHERRKRESQDAAWAALVEAEAIE